MKAKGAIKLSILNSHSAEDQKQILNEMYAHKSSKSRHVSHLDIHATRQNNVNSVETPSALLVITAF